MRATVTETGAAWGGGAVRAPDRGTFVWLEALAVLASPALLDRLLRLRGMAPAGLPDPSMHTTFILDPGAVFTRYAALFTPTSRLREALRAGFLVPARLFYLLFGALPGYFVFRYVLALIAIVPLYLLVRKLYGRWAGWVGIAVVMSSPVIVTAWGTDYPDAGAVSYLIGALAALALSLDADGRRPAWLPVGTGLLTLTVWSHGVSVPLAIVMVLAYVAMRAWREQPGLLRDLAAMLACGLGVTLLLAIGSKLLIGPFNFITPTLRSASYLSQPAQEALYHSVSNAWARYDNYLLVPPAVVIASLIVFAQRLRELPVAIVFIGATGALQVIVFAYLQFLGSLQTLEQHYFSSTLWSSVTVLLVLTVAEMAKPIVATGLRAARPLTRALAGAVPALLVVAVALAYELIDYVPRASWTWRGLALAGAVVAVVALHRMGAAWVGRAKSHGAPAVLATGAIALVLGGLLILTVAQPSPHPLLPDTVFDPYPAYSTALGGSEAAYVDSYAVDAKIPAFVGNPTYKGEILLQWEPADQFGQLQGPMGIYHNAFTWVSATFPVPGADGLRKIEGWHAAQVVMMSLTGQDFATAVASLARFDPVVVRRGFLSHGPRHLHIWLVDLTRNMQRNAAAA